MTNLPKGMLNARCPAENVKATSITWRDAHYIMDGGEQSNQPCYLQPFTHGQQIMSYAVPKKLSNMFEHESVVARAQKERSTTGTGWLEHQKTVAITRDTWGGAAEGKERLLHEGLQSLATSIQ